MENIDTKSETKADRFVRIAERRTRAVLKDLRLLGNCGNRGNYAYTNDAIRKIFGEVETAVKAAKAKFHSAKEEQFKL